MRSWHSLLTHQWRAKLMALLLATLLWLFIRHSINYTPTMPPYPLPLPPIHVLLPHGGNGT